MEKAKRIPKGIPLIISIIFLAGITIYIIIGFNYKTHFLPGTEVFGIDISEKTIIEAEEMIQNGISSHTIAIVTKDGEEEQITGYEYELTYVSDGKLQQLMDKQNWLTWIGALFEKSRERIIPTATYNRELLSQVIGNLNMISGPFVTAPKNAYVEFVENDYIIVAETPGSTIIESQLLQLVKECITSGRIRIVLQNENYVQPEVTSDSEAIIKHLELMKKYLSMTVIYNFEDRQEVLDGVTIGKWVQIDVDNNLIIDTEKIKEFVDDLAVKYNTFGDTRVFETSVGTTIEVSGGDYGWLINRPQEVKELTEIIRAGESLIRIPVYLQEGVSRLEDDTGGTYVEINYTKQHMWFYKDGELLVDTAVVTGNVSQQNDSPTGTFPIVYKQRDATLKGADYETKVSYWMPFYRDVGIHDAAWRNAFGGKIYLEDGSHGCINTPLAAVKIIYNNISAGIPVICYMEEEISSY